MNKLLIAVMVSAIPVCAQNPARPTMAEELQRSVIYEFQNVDSNRGRQIVDFFRQVVSTNSVYMEVNLSMNAAVIHAYNPGDSEKVIEFLKKYDVKQPEVELTAYLVLATPPTETHVTPGNTIPAGLQDAITQMKQILPDRNYSLRDSIMMKVSNEGQYEGVIPGGVGLYYSLLYGKTALSRDGKSISISPFRFSLKPPCASGKDCPTLQIGTDTVIHDGQKLVFGKVPVPSLSSGDLFVVLTAKVVTPGKQ